jgi:N6-L-threonylcarbamoyladenine synthase
MSDGSDDFSFSGYKTAVLKLTRENNITEGSPVFRDLVASFLHSVVDYLLLKTRKAVENYQVKSIIISGGVSRNSLLREKFQNEFKNKSQELYIPALKYCTDNATMTAWLGYEIYKAFPQRNYFDYYLNAYSRTVFRANRKHR